MTGREEEAAAAAASIGFPLLVKAVAGGGGKGMRLVRSLEELSGALRTASSEALSAFGDGSLYLERYIERPRHVEVQLLGDGRGRAIAFVERECSVQRRHQKVVEESPSPAVDETTRRALAEAAAGIARRVEYANAGTIEFLLAPDGSFYFLEMNTRLQVEHPITEAVTGVDLVQWQLRLASGEDLALDQDAVLVPRGHAIEARIYAEDPDNGFLPSPGRVTSVRSPGGPGIREDSGISGSGDVPVFYDSLISKLVVWGHTRERAIARLARALDEYQIEGVRTTLPFFRWLVAQDAFRAAQIDTSWLDAAIAARAGGDFGELNEDTARLASLVAAVAAHASTLRSAALPGRAAPSMAPWAVSARREALR